MNRDGPVISDEPALAHEPARLDPSRDTASEPARSRLWGLVVKTLVSCFVILNVLAILRSNRPVWAGRVVEAAVDDAFGPHALYRTRYAGWMLDRYAHLSGLNNRWVMFSHQSRFNWWYGVQAIGPDNVAADLNLPLIGERSMSQQILFDFREAKYHLNLYSSLDLRTRYARYLCRQLPVTTGTYGLQVQAIRFLLHHQELLYPAQARERGTHLEPDIYTRTLNEVTCLPRG